MVEKNQGVQTVVVGGVSAVAGTVLGFLLAGKPAEAAPPESKWDYFIECQETMIALLEKLLVAQGAEIAVSVKTPWVAKEPEQILDQAIRSVGTVNTDKMIDFTKGKRLAFKVESSLDQAIIVQLVDSLSDSFMLATNTGPPLPCVANGNISVGLAWDDWRPFIGVRITTAIAPTTGILKIWAVIQE